ncbi:MAG: hypothetical protein ACREDD_07040 [Methylocella sp.]
MKLVAALSTAVFVLAPAVGLAQDAGNTKNEPGLVDKAIGKMTGRTQTTKEDAKDSSTAQSPGNTNYPDLGAVKKTGK